VYNCSIKISNDEGAISEGVLILSSNGLPFVRGGGRRGREILSLGSIVEGYAGRFILATLLGKTFRLADVINRVGPILVLVSPDVSAVHVLDLNCSIHEILVGVLCNSPGVWGVFLLGGRHLVDNGAIRKLYLDSPIFQHIIVINLKQLLLF
jgi:hypothetical protein